MAANMAHPHSETLASSVSSKSAAAVATLESEASSTDSSIHQPLRSSSPSLSKRSTISQPSYKVVPLCNVCVVSCVSCDSGIVCLSVVVLVCVRMTLCKMQSSQTSRSSQRSMHHRPQSVFTNVRGRSMLALEEDGVVSMHVKRGNQLFTCSYILLFLFHIFL